MWNFIVISYKSGGDFFFGQKEKSQNKCAIMLCKETIPIPVLIRDHTYIRVDQRPYLYLYLYLYPCWSMINDLYQLLTPFINYYENLQIITFTFVKHLLTPLWFLHIKSATWNWRYMYLCVPWYYGKQVRCFRGMIWLSYLFHRIHRSPCP